MAKVEYLTQIKGTWYVRRRVPIELVEAVGKSELKRSLRTKTKSIAVNRYSEVADEFEALLSKHTTGDNSDLASSSMTEIGLLDSSQLFRQRKSQVRMAELSMRQRVFECLSNNQTTEKLWDFHPGVKSERKAFLDKVMEEGDIKQIARTLVNERCKYRIHDLEEQLQLGDFEDLLLVAKAVVGPNIANQVALVRIARTLAEAEIAGLESIDLETERSKQDDNSVSNNTGIQLSESREQGPQLSKALEKWIDKHDWVPKTTNERRANVGYFIEICGDKPIDSYTKADVRKAQNVFSSIPPNAHKKADFKGLGIVDISKKAVSGNYDKPTNKSVNLKIEAVSALFNWLLVNYDEITTNPLKGIRLATNTSLEPPREPFSIDELNKLFHCPVYTGCKSIVNWSQPGSVILKEAALYWIPLAALFSGMRIREIAHIENSELDIENSIPSFNLQFTEIRRLKNQSSIRVIPIHRSLIELGFLDFVKSRRNQQRLFSEICDGPATNPASPASRLFNRLLENAGVKRKQISFHSFRHTFQDGCRNSDIPLDVARALQGHSEPGMSGRYGKGFSPEALNNHLQKLSFNRLDIGHLLK